MLPLFLSLQGPDLSERERAFFRETQPAGFILFNRNVTGRAQVRRLTDDLRALMGRDRLPILIDQEGGRVQVLARPPGFVPDAIVDVIGRNKNADFPLFPAAAEFGRVFTDSHENGLRAAYLNARLMGRLLQECGLTVACAPVLDLPVEGAHGVIGDRAFSSDAEVVEELARAFMDGLSREGIVPVIKHIPGHGRAKADSHFEAPRVSEDLDILQATDFAPFLALGDAPMAMTAHVVYEAVDPVHTATVSTRVISDVIRGFCRFDGLLMTDALEMGAMHGSLGERARESLAAGCDIALYCSGKLEDMEELAKAVPPLDPLGARRLVSAMAWPGQKPPPALGDDTPEEMVAERDSILASPA